GGCCIGVARFGGCRGRLCPPDTSDRRVASRLVWLGPIRFCFDLYCYSFGGAILVLIQAIGPWGGGLLRGSASAFAFLDRSDLGWGSSWGGSEAGGGSGVGGACG